MLRWIYRQFLALALAIGILAVFIFPAQAADPVVKATMFWEEGCPNCELVITDFLPGFQAELDGKFVLELVEIVSLDDVDRLFRIGAAYGLSREQVGVPLMVVGDTALVGSRQIPDELPALVARYLAEGGVDTVVREDSAVVGQAADAVEAEEANEDNGMWLAWVTMGVMAAGLLFTIWQMWRSFSGAVSFRLPAWAEWLTPGLAVAGMFVAIYLTFIETTKAQAICGPIGDCNAVQNSPYAMLFGVFPVGVMGLLGYIGILGAWVTRRARWGVITEYAPVILLAMTLFGTIFSVYLTYVELFVIFAVCIWCISSAWIMTILMMLSLPAASTWIAAAEEEEE